MAITSPLLSSNLGAAVSQVANRVRASVAEVHSRGGSGSGTVWSSDPSANSGGTGIVITNHHVVQSDRARITLEAGRSYEGSVFARDPRNDLAALRVESHDLPAATLGDARHLRAGDLVLAVGNPAGVRGAVSVGVVHRALPRSHAGRGRELIQADVLLGPGSSGGPLTDARGRVVGINAMVHATPTGWQRGSASGTMALAVPTHVVARLLGRSGERPTLGIEAHEVTLPPSLAERLPQGVADTAGAAVSEDGTSALIVAAVTSGSAAERAGLLLGDVLYAVNGARIEGSAGLLNALDAHAARIAGAAPLALGVLRGGEPRELLVTWS